MAKAAVSPRETGRRRSVAKRARTGAGEPAPAASAGSPRRSPQAVQAVRDAAGASGLLRPRGSVVAMLSGGRDSVCLLHVAVSICGAGSVRALHVNYGLRGEDAELDERHCAALCECLGVPLQSVRARREERPSGNLQAWARDVRYAAALRIARERGARTVVATGHTASDQVETILYRLAASPGRRALLGMSASEGRLLRPLLGITREQTAAYCRACGLPWREDESNESGRYARARVRQGLVRELRAVHPAAEANVLRTAALLREETTLLEALVSEQLAGADEVAIERLRQLAPALQRQIVIRLAEQVTGAFVPQAGDRVGEIIELADRAGRRGNAELHVGGLAGAVIQGGVLRMIKLPPRDG